MDKGALFRFGVLKYEYFYLFHCNLSPFQRCVLSFRRHSYRYNFLQDNQHGKQEHVYAETLFYL